MLLSDVLALLHKYAVLDFIIDGVLIGVSCVLKYSIGFSDDFVPFITSDIDNPLSTNTFSYGSVCLITFGVGLVIVVVFWLSNFLDAGAFRAAASYIFAISSAMFICSILAKLVGRPRPDTIAVCGDEGSYQKCASVLDARGLTYQFSSFPNTESAEAMAAAVFISLYLAELIAYFNNLTSLISVIPVFSAFFVAASCIWDRKSHIDDVVVGLVIGTITGLVSFRTFKKNIKEKKLERRPGAYTETSSLPMPKYN
jgi:diacylglycerol diphosphate phosphatase/phosphatidate phosphatase